MSHGIREAGTTHSGSASSSLRRCNHTNLETTAHGSLSRGQPSHYMASCGRCALLTCDIDIDNNNDNFLGYHDRHNNHNRCPNHDNCDNHKRCPNHNPCTNHDNCDNHNPCPDDDNCNMAELRCSVRLSVCTDGHF